IQRKQFAIRDARFHGNGVKHAGELKIRRELRQSGDFARTVYTEGIASDGRRTWWRLLRGRHCSSLTQLAAAIRSACVRQRLASSILNLFSLCGFASRRAASPAWRKIASVAGLPVSAASASGERQGFVPTPPSAMRARETLPLAIVSTTAADARANSYDARSRSFR